MTIHGPGVLDRLVVGAVDRETLGPGDAMEQGAGDDPHVVPGLVARVGLAVRQGIRDLVGDVLDQGAAERHVEQLLAAADAEHRHLAGKRASGRGELERGAAILGGDRRMPGRRAEQRRIDVEPAAGHDQPVDMVEIILGGIGLVRQQDRQSAGAAHRVAVILADRIPRKLRPAARGLVIEGEADDRLCHAGVRFMPMGPVGPVGR